MEPSYVAAAVSLRRSHPRAPAQDILDLVMMGKLVGDLDPAEPWLAPATPFGQLVAEAFDHGLTLDEWKRWTQPPADPRMIAATINIWRVYVVPRFAEAYGGFVGDPPPWLQDCSRRRISEELDFGG